MEMDEEKEIISDGEEEKWSNPKNKNIILYIYIIYFNMNK